jgi:ribosomal-protein-alanine N-acetyltransferase
MHKQNQLITERLLLQRPVAADGTEVLAYRLANRGHLQPWEPERQARFYTLEAVEEQLRKMERQDREQVAQYWLLRSPDSGAMIGECSFTNIIRGPFQACHLGFSLGHEYQGKGLMHEALLAAIRDIFENHRLNRIMANYQPGNHRSEKLLSRLGFQQEGIARNYLKINGSWADHILTALLNPTPP